MNVSTLGAVLGLHNTTVSQVSSTSSITTLNWTSPTTTTPVYNTTSYTATNFSTTAAVTLNTTNQRHLVTKALTAFTTPVMVKTTDLLTNSTARGLHSSSLFPTNGSLPPFGQQCKDSEYGPIQFVAIAVSVIIIFLNIMVIVAIKKGPRGLHKPMYVFVTSLAVADLLLGLISFYSFLANDILDVKIAPFEWMLRKLIIMMTLMASAGSLLVIGVDRYITIVHHVAYVTRKHAIIAVCVIWALAIAIATIPLMGWNCVEHCKCQINSQALNDSRPNCDHPSCSVALPPFTTGFLTLIFTVFIVALLLQSFVYFRTYFSIHQQTSLMESHKIDDHREPADIVFAKTMALVLIVFVLCYAPLMAMILIDVTTGGAGGSGMITPSVLTYGTVPAILNSAMNPLIYVFRIRKMRRAFGYLLCCCCREKFGVESDMFESSRVPEKVRMIRVGKLNSSGHRASPQASRQFRKLKESTEAQPLSAPTPPPLDPPKDDAPTADVEFATTC
ncbi:sphingosine 1-phosphate receptor 1-like [Branchiostoma floridae]|uniref:Sphingosine 1-phosphate receptor 1-like n=1 Tax=Branchiostoma floridae TaxID=7739 RepID=A0A9J7HIS9_BRAFL|nr:sphingosine 1-phosphate receptor 1-like [Branchiostoma floridae]XP_035657993.1 sphingosine 1-phosphate receptor 1-like [Branchiostoma floridae]